MWQIEIYNTVWFFLGPSSVASMSQSSFQSPQHQQSPHHQQQPQQIYPHLHQGQQPESSSKTAFYQYLTPPSQHSGGHTPQHLVQTLDSYPTPSPESPGHWSSSSPHSASDWSEIQSPANQNHYVTSGAGGHQNNKGSEAIYI